MMNWLLGARRDHWFLDEIFFTKKFLFFCLKSSVFLLYDCFFVETRGRLREFKSSNPLLTTFSLSYYFTTSKNIDMVMVGSSL